MGLSIKKVVSIILSLVIALGVFYLQQSFILVTKQSGLLSIGQLFLSIIVYFLLGIAITSIYSRLNLFKNISSINIIAISFLILLLLASIYVYFMLNKYPIIFDMKYLELLCLSVGFVTGAELLKRCLS